MGDKDLAISQERKLDLDKEVRLVNCLQLVKAECSRGMVEAESCALSSASWEEREEKRRREEHREKVREQEGSMQGSNLEDKERAFQKGDYYGLS